MALDTYKTIWNKVLLRCPLAGPYLARDWVTNSFRRLAERRAWSWLLKQNQFLTTALYNTGTVQVTRGSTTVTGNATAFTTAMEDRQFRIGVTAPIYTIASVNVIAQTLTLDVAYGAATNAASTYEIYSCFMKVPSDFNYLFCLWDPNYNWQLYKDISQVELNLWDAQRSNSGQAYLASPRDYLDNLPRYEIWPHVKSEYCYPFLYIARATDLQDTNAVLPYFIRGDVLVEMSLAEAAKWPGPSIDKPNPYFNLKLAQLHEAKAEFMINELERQDDEVHMQNATYSKFTSLPYAPFPFGDSAWLQKHAI